MEEERKEVGCRDITLRNSSLCLGLEEEEDIPGALKESNKWVNSETYCAWTG
jgi:hypothetical protein